MLRFMSPLCVIDSATSRLVTCSTHIFLQLTSDVSSGQDTTKEGYLL